MRRLVSGGGGLIGSHVCELMSDTKKKPIVSIVIRTRNEEGYVEEVLKAIFRQKSDLLFEVVVVDSGSTDTTLDIVKRYKTRIYEIEPADFSFGFSLNYGIEKAEGSFVVCLSAHCIPVDENWMTSLLAPLLADAAVVATYGRQEPVKGLNPFEELLLLKQFCCDTDGKVDAFFSNANCAIRKHVLMAHPFDETATSGEDYIWAKTLPEGSLIRYVHKASVYHSHPMSLKYWGKRFYNGALFKQYLQAVYGLKWQGIWPENDGKDAGILLGKLIKSLQSGLGEFVYIVLFMLKNRYFSKILMVPVFVVLFHYNNWKGTRDGKKIYGGS